MAIDKNSNRYIIGYAVIMIVVVAVVLSTVALALQERQHGNVLIEKKANILSSVGINTTPEDKDQSKRDFVESQFERHIVNAFAVDSRGEEVKDVNAFTLLNNLKAEFAKPDESRTLPVFVARTDSGDEIYIFPVYGAGLWGALWGYIALERDFNTVYGVNFDHAGETPGLGAEVATPMFWKHFSGKQIFDGLGNFVSINVLKGAGASAGNINAVDAISGGTITSHGVQNMLYNSLSAYMPLIDKHRKLYLTGRSSGAAADISTELIVNENGDTDNE